jgi:HK97 family phage major capsid protein
LAPGPLTTTATTVDTALAEPDLIVLNPQDWSTARRVKDGFQRFIVSADPSGDETNTAWGLNVLTTTQCPVGKGPMIATSLFGYVGVREPLGMRVGYANDDLTRNILRFVGEERLTLCVTRPAAVLKAAEPTRTDNSRRGDTDQEHGQEVRRVGWSPGA